MISCFFVIRRYIVALGTGGIKPNVSTLGADQFDERYSKDRREKESFFNWFYWSINLGALIAYSLVAYICQFGITGLGGKQWGFFVGYSIPSITMALAILTFVAGSRRYKILKPSGSVMDIAFKICAQALYRKIRGDPLMISDRSSFASSVNAGNAGTTGSEKGSEKASTGKGCAMRSPETFAHTEAFSIPEPVHLLDRSKSVYGGSFSSGQV
jgi:peptide/histidine transporter 3/4